MTSLMPTVTLVDGIPRVSSLDIADRFGKRHERVLDVIRKIIADLPAEFTEHNFVLSDYTDSTGRKLPLYLLTRDAFSLVVMGFTGKAALAWKVRYIEAFNAMEAKLLKRQLPVGSQPTAPPKPPCTDLGMKPLDAAVNAWAKTGKIPRTEALARLRAHFGVASCELFWPEELIEPALVWVQEQTTGYELPATASKDLRAALVALNKLAVGWGALAHAINFTCGPEGYALLKPAAERAHHDMLQRLKTAAAVGAENVRATLLAIHAMSRL